MSKSKWALLAILLAMMMAMTGCFGGGGWVETGGVTGYVWAPTEDVDLLEATKGQSAIKNLVIEPIYKDYKGLPGAKVRAVGTRRIATTGFNGHFVLDRIPVGNQIIEITHEAYKGKLTIPVPIEANRNRPIEKQRIEGKGYYLLIGVGKYDETDFWTQYGYPQKPETIEATSNDIDIMARVFSADNALLGAPPVVLKDAAAKRDKVITAVELLAKNMKKGDYLVIYFSGHGVGGQENHSFDGIVLYDDFMADYELRYLIEDVADSYGLSLSDVTLLIDSCYSGSFADGYEREKQRKAFMGEGYTVITSSQPDEESWTRDKSNSLFTYYLERGLGGQEADYNVDGVIYASELYNYLRDEVSLEQPKQSVYRYFGAGNPIIFKTIDY